MSKMMIKNFEEWKNSLLENWDKSIHGDHLSSEKHNRYIESFCNCIDAVNFEATEEVADVLFTLFTEENDYEMLESVVNQLDCMHEQKIFVRCLLKAFPRLVKEAPRWAMSFLFSICGSIELKKYIMQSEDYLGKQAIVDFIKELNEAPPHESCLKNEKLMQAHLDDLARFNKLSEDIQNSMKLAT
jgi:hypothetical protein